MAKYGMAIDLQKCVGCGACALACKTENNTEFEHDHEKYNWADFLTSTEGTFAESNLKYKVFPVLCNHCTDAPCVEICPVVPKAMYKSENGITLHNEDLCIGCQFCQQACPYSSKNVDNDNVQYSVISYNPDYTNTQSFYENETEVIPGGTSSPAEVVEMAGIVPPDKNEYTHPDYNAVRPSDVTEKCIFCDHRVQNGELPYCVSSCPSSARIFGDLDDSNSDISKALVNGYSRLRDNSGAMLGSGENGTNPNVFYINDFTVGVSENVHVSKPVEKLHVYPNPATAEVNAVFDMEKSGDASLSLYDITGKEIMSFSDGKNYGIGKLKFSFDVSELKSGTYVVRVLTSDKAFTASLIVK